MQEKRNINFKGIGDLVEKLVNNPNLYFEIQNIIECINTNFEGRTEENEEELQKVLNEQISGFLNKEFQKKYKELINEKE